jgi:N-acetylneuraminic acid mutarotase
MHCACAVGEVIYVIGGTEDLAGDTLATRSVLTFDIRTQSWSEVAPMPAGRQEAAACVLGYDIYVFGEQRGGVETSSIFRLNTMTNKWTTLAPMPEAKHGHGVCVVDGLIYVVGGRFANSIFGFDPAAASWRILALMSTIRHGGSVFALGGIVYVTGGYHYQIEHSSVERHCAASDTWTLVEGMEMGAAISHFGTIVLEGGDEMDFFDHLIAEANRASV